jgi:hypothetical protein
VHTLVPLNAGDPDNRVVIPIGGRNPWRAAAGLAHAPGERYRRRICWRNLIRPDRVRLIMKRKIFSLARMVSDSGCSSVGSSDIRLGHS